VAKVAVFDVDGTLIPRVLGLELARRLAVLGAAIDLAELEDLLGLYGDGELSHEAMTAGAHRIYAEGLAGLGIEEVRAAAAVVWQQVADQVFSYARPVISLLTTAGFRVLLISGSPAEVVELAAAELGVQGWHGASLRTAGGRYLPKIVSAPAMPGGKLQALRALTRARPVDLSSSLAVGNAPSDIELLKRVGRPYAFEPDQALRQVAESQSWPIVDRHNAVERIGCPERIGGGVL
jgi:HAD superfamily phosphoserine phosphatase-like hydrolase